MAWYSVTMRRTVEEIYTFEAKNSDDARYRAMRFDDIGEPLEAYTCDWQIVSVKKDLN